MTAGQQLQMLNSAGERAENTGDIGQNCRVNHLYKEL